MDEVLDCGCRMEERGIPYAQEFVAEPDCDQHGIFAALNRFYGLNVHLGQRVVADGSPGVVVGIADGSMHLLVKLDGAAETPGHWHPTWNMEYVDG